jgi:hypothetical protein
VLRYLLLVLDLLGLDLCACNVSPRGLDLLDQQGISPDVPRKPIILQLVHYALKSGNFAFDERFQATAAVLSKMEFLF